MNLIPYSVAIMAILVILLITFAITRGRRPRSVLLAALAGRWNGRLREGGMLFGDRLEILVDDVPGVITFSESPRNDWRSAGWTRIRFKGPAAHRLRVLPKDIVDVHIRRFLGARPVRFDDPAFEDRFWVESSDPAWARAVLDPGMRRELIKLQWSPRGPFRDKLLLDVGPSGVDLRLSRVLVDHTDMLGIIVELAITVLRRSHVSTTPGGVVLGQSSTQPGSACPVCGHPVEAGPLCPRCRTPHHGDCWAYMGGCAIFGCSNRPAGETVYDRRFPVMPN